MKPQYKVLGVHLRGAAAALTMEAARAMERTAILTMMTVVSEDGLKELNVKAF